MGEEGLESFLTYTQLDGNFSHPVHQNHPPPTPHTHNTQAQNANDSGDQDTARRLGRFSLGWNIGVYIFYVLLTIAWIIAVAVIVSQATRSTFNCVRVNGRLVCG